MTTTRVPWAPGGTQSPCPGSECLVLGPQLARVRWQQATCGPPGWVPRVVSPCGAGLRPSASGLGPCWAPARALAGQKTCVREPSSQPCPQGSCGVEPLHSADEKTGGEAPCAGGELWRGHVGSQPPAWRPECTGHAAGVTGVQALHQFHATAA